MNFDFSEWYHYFIIVLCIIAGLIAIWITRCIWANACVPFSDCCTCICKCFGFCKKNEMQRL